MENMVARAKFRNIFEVSLFVESSHSAVPLWEQSSGRFGWLFRVKTLQNGIFLHASSLYSSTYSRPEMTTKGPDRPDNRLKNQWKHMHHDVKKTIYQFPHTYILVCPQRMSSIKNREKGLKVSDFTYSQ